MGFEPGIFQSQGECLNHWANEAAWDREHKGYLPEPGHLFAAALVMPVDGVPLPVVNIHFLHSTQHQLHTRTHPCGQMYHQATKQIINTECQLPFKFLFSQAAGAMAPTTASS